MSAPFPWMRVAGAALVASLVLAASVDAQFDSLVCGDASGDGNVTVSDGVQVLRAAAELSNTCTPATCDVDGNGTITVTDGVNVLRKAAELSAPNQCGGGNPDADVATVTEAVAPLLLFGFTAISDVSLPGAAGARGSVEPAGVQQIDVDDCPDGGVRRKVLLGGCIVNVAFDVCRYSAPGLGRFEFEKTISVNFCRSEVALAVEVKDLDSNAVVNFDGFLAFTPTGDGGFVADGGPITINTPQGAFELSFQQLTFNDEGQPVSGAGQISDTDDNFSLQSIAFTATGGATASLVATFDDGHQSSYVLNLITGALAPA
jgi:hypothetical protein